jgi:hypothetical protein
MPGRRIYVIQSRMALQYVTFLPRAIFDGKSGTCYLTENMRLDFGRRIAACEAAKGS